MLIAKLLATWVRCLNLAGCRFGDDNAMGALTFVTCWLHIQWCGLDIRCTRRILQVCTLVLCRRLRRRLLESCLITLFALYRTATAIAISRTSTTHSVSKLRVSAEYAAERVV